MRGAGLQAVVGLDADLPHELDEDRVAGVDGAVGVDRAGGRLGVVAEADLLRVGRLVGGRLGRRAREGERAEGEEDERDHRAGGEDGALVSAVDRLAVTSAGDRAQLARAALIGGPAAIAPTPLTLRAHEEQKPHPAAQQRGHEGRVQPVQDVAAVGDAEGELADHVRARRMVGVGEVVVVAAGREATAVDRDDAVQDDEAQRLAVIRDDVADPILGAGPDHREVAAVEARRHAGAARADVAGLPSDLGRGEQQPRGDGQYDQRGADQACTQMGGSGHQAGGCLLRRGNGGGVVVRGGRPGRRPAVHSRQPRGLSR
jgi:hypothetical protein